MMRLLEVTLWAALMCLLVAIGARAQDPLPEPTPDACTGRLQAQREQWERQCDEAVSLEVGKRVRQCEQLLQQRVATPK